MQLKDTNMTTSEPLFDERYISETLATLESNDSRPHSGHSSQSDLEAHAQSILRNKCLDECENAIADLPTQVAENLLSIFDQVADSFLPGPLWQAPLPPSKDTNSSASSKAKQKPRSKESNIVLRCLKIVSAARLALASHGKKDQPLKVKVERLFSAAARYLDSVPQYDILEDAEALLLLAELEYGRNRSDSARSRLKAVIAALTNEGRMRSMMILGNGASLLRRRNALRTALLMLHWYFNEVPTSLEDLHTDLDGDLGELAGNAEELFVTSQLRLASLHGRLKRFLDAQPVVDDKVWQSCEKSFNIWYDELREQSRNLDTLTEDASVNFFVFHQQYLSTRIMLSKSHDRLYKRRSSMRSSQTPRELWTCPASAKNDAVKIASSLRNYGQRHRFREAPLSFVNHISAAADLVINATEAAMSEDDRNAYLHISSFLCSVLNYMAEVHVRASTLLEALQQRMNTVILNPAVRPSSVVNRWEGSSSIYSSTNGHDGHLWQWTRHNTTDDFGLGTSTPQPERPQSVAGVLQTQTSILSQRPHIIRHLSTPATLSASIDEGDEGEVDTLTPSYYSTKDNISLVGQAV